jgi:hypothetical protein
MSSGPDVARLQPLAALMMVSWQASHGGSDAFGVVTWNVTWKRYVVTKV